MIALLAKAKLVPKLMKNKNTKELRNVFLINALTIVYARDVKKVKLKIK